MNILKTANAITTIGGIITLVAGAFWFMDYRHAKKHALLEHTLRAEAQALDRMIRDDNEAREHYERLATEGELSPARRARLLYLERKLERSYEDQDAIQAELIALESEDH